MFVILGIQQLLFDPLQCLISRIPGNIIVFPGQIVRQTEKDIGTQNVFLHEC